MSAPRTRTISLPTRRTAALGLLGAPAAAAALGACGSASANAYGFLAGGGAWLNSQPLRPADLRGKVVLVNFWTYTCINSLRPLPYLRAWAEKYRDRGLVVVGVHAPEFSFEHDISRVRTAVEDLGVAYPVVLDNDFRIWRAFGNSAWPGFFFLDAEGRVRHQRLGEGDYERSEQVLQALLAASRGAPVIDRVTAVVAKGPQAAPDWEDLESPETYAGYAKADRFAPAGGLRRDMDTLYRTPARLTLNDWSLSGQWTARPEFTELTGAAGAIAYRFHARDLHLVMGPATDDRPVAFQVRIEGAEPGLDHGFDTDFAGRGELREARMYQLVRQVGPVRDRTVEITFQGPGARVFCFTFG